MKKIFFLSFLVISGCNIDTKQHHSANVGDSLPTGQVSVAEPETHISINAVGDLMLGSDFPNTKRLPKKNPLATLQDTLKNADLTIGNLEGVIASPSTTTEKCKDSKNCFVFRMPPRFASYFKQAGFDFLSIANNHSGDFGNLGIKESLNALKNEGIAVAGLKHQQEFAIVVKNGLNIGFIGVGHGGRHVHINDKEYIASLIKKVKPQCDILIIFFHGGAEGIDKDRVPKATEFLHGENRGNVHEFSHRCIDAGADLVIGSGPHVTRGLELYKNKLIAYSLGNFATYGMSTRGALGVAPILNLSLTKTGDFVRGHIIPTIQEKGNPLTPRIDTGNHAIKIMHDLTKKDFPNTNLDILLDGTIRIKSF